ncbi:ATP-dependent zinc metalloprotease FtsH, partial [Amycolatopsis lurida]|uniref:ATP-dependent zinc metalloprotease FtsH n=1 Tax=Amycolatopsis lurida TaxID=31959 RepID=UPI003658C212
MSRTAKPGPPSDPIPPAAPPEPSGRRRWVVPAVFLVMLLLFFLPHLLTAETPSFGYTEFLSKVDTGQVEKITVDDEGAIKGNLRDGTAFTTQLPVAFADDQLLPKLKEKGVQVTGAQGGSSAVLSFVGSLVPLLLLVGFLVWMSKGAQRSLAGAGGFGRSKAKIIEAQRPTTRFADVAGYEGVKQEVSEIVDFLRDPDRYAAAGAKGPRGVIMVGPPGTGKTLLARAVAGEASVPFLSVTGSEFVEMFVGVGASRVRDLFTEARNRAPSIIFIDEIDAVGSRRGFGGTGGHDEREQTLNQLLAEMDGFDQSSGIVVLAATNRPESLDHALLRPGRFDRQVTVPLPNQDERAAILAVHVHGKHLGPDVDLRRVARGTPGFSGADLANLVNEGAINAVRDGRTTITAADLDSARDRVLLGRRETSNALLPEERHAVAVHESGHALIAALCEHADPVAKVTILPVGMALGATEQLPEAERHLYSEAYLTDLLAVRLGGRAAELVVFRQGSTGAADDLAGATALAVKMVTEFGLSTALGPVAYPAAHNRFLAEDPAERRQGGFSERTQQVIDREVARLAQHAALMGVLEERPEPPWKAAGQEE